MGEGALAYELQDALAREFRAENIEAFDSEQRLTYEWTYLLTSLYKLQQQSRDHTLLRYPELVDYAFSLTGQMSNLDELVSIVMPPLDSYDDPIPLQNLIKKGKYLFKTKEVAADTYYAHNGLHETAWRAGRLEIIAGIYDLHISKSPYYVGDKKYSASTSDRRLAASVHEELGSLNSADPELHQAIAYRYNQEFVSEENIPWYDLQKVHSLFSLYDIDYRRSLGPLMGRKDREALERSRLFVGMNQQRFYADLHDRASYIDELLDIADQCSTTSEKLMWSGRAHTQTGALTEMTVLGELRDAITERGLQLSVEARQSFLREDNNPRVRRYDNPKKYMITPNFSFDLVLQQHGDHGPMTRLNIEVKKSHQSEIYLSDTFVLSAQDEFNNREFSDRLRRMSEAKIALHQGIPLTASQKSVLADTRRRLNPHRIIDELLYKAA